MWDNCKYYDSTIFMLTFIIHYNVANRHYHISLKDLNNTIYNLIIWRFIDIKLNVIGSSLIYLLTNWAATTYIWKDVSYGSLVSIGTNIIYWTIVSKRDHSLTEIFKIYCKPTYFSRYFISRLTLSSPLRGYSILRLSY